MPRDFFSPPSDSPSAKEQQLVASPESQTPTPAAISQTFEHGEPTLEAESPGWENEDGTTGASNHFMIRHDDSMRGTAMQLLRGRGAQQANAADDLHPFVQTLGMRDLESCLALENACFPEAERESRETFAYRLTTCPELCLGLFSSVPKPSDPSKVPTYITSLSPDSTNPSQKAVLIAMVIATKTTTAVATDSAMQFPADWAHRSAPQTTKAAPAAAATTNDDDARGHKEHGRTITVWTLGVLPSYQGKGLGKTVMKSYQQRMETSGIADRIALLARERLVGLYKGFGFEEKGESEVKFAGGGWTDMAYEFVKEEGLGYS